jgi:hypothetical protein
MFGGLQLKIIIAVILFSLVSGGILYIRYLKSELELAIQQQQVFEDAIKGQQKQIDSYAEDIQQMQNINENLLENFNRASTAVRDLSNRFDQNSAGERRDLNRSAIQRPQLIENLINSGTRYALRCNELVGGGSYEPSDNENNICPDLIEKLKGIQ